MSNSNQTHDHRVIKDWAEQRGRNKHISQIYQAQLNYPAATGSLHQNFICLNEPNASGLALGL